MSTAVVGHKNPGLWKSLGEAIRGSRHNYTEGSISRAILLLATPMVLEMLMESLFAVVNVFWVTRLGSDAVATVGLTESMLTLVFSVAIGISMSTTAMVARRIGESKPREAAVAGSQSILLGCFIAVLMGVPAAIFAPELLALMGASDAVIQQGSGYARIVLGSNVVVMLLFLQNGIFRGAGDAYLAMRVLWTSNLINLVLDPCFIFGIGPFPELGITGAAVSTLVGRSFGVAFQLWMLMTGRSRVHIHASDFRIVPDVLKTLMRVSVTGILQFAISHTSWIALVRMVSSFGSVAVAGYTIGIRIFIFAVLPSWGLSGAAATMVGQNLGAGKPDRAQRAVYLTAFYNAIFLGAVALAFVLTPEVLVGLFTTDPAVSGYAVDCLRIIGFGNLAYAFGMVMVQAFNGAGDTVTPTIVNVIGFWLVEIPVAWLLAYPAGLQVRGVFIAIPIAHVVITILGVTLFLRGKWKARAI
ncbi:MAG TPA: MATE family efflux transporter [Bryobacteraceae bacterium]|nr:MATE family efflux transporter [Bryobacteraceae bacterium]